MLDEKNRKHIQVDDTLFIATFQVQIYGNEGEPLVKNGNKWKLEKDSYHKNTFLRPLIGYFASLEEARAEAERMVNGGRTGG